MSSQYFSSVERTSLVISRSLFSGRSCPSSQEEYNTAWHTRSRRVTRAKPDRAFLFARVFIQKSFNVPNHAFDFSLLRFFLPFQLRNELLQGNKVVAPLLDERRQQFFILTDFGYGVLPAGKLGIQVKPILLFFSDQIFLMEEFGLERIAPTVKLLAPLGYLETVGLMERSTFVLTDSGGLQEETTVLGVPCLTARPNTERPVTVTEGTNRLVASTTTAVLEAVDQLLAAQEQGSFGARRPEFWDGHAGERVVEALVGGNRTW